ncbi:MAG: hypothetical protein WAO35_20240 [Terriglobia bacterium]
MDCDAALGALDSMTPKACAARAELVAITGADLEGERRTGGYVATDGKTDQLELLVLGAAGRMASSPLVVPPVLGYWNTIRPLAQASQRVNKK